MTRQIHVSLVLLFASCGPGEPTAVDSSDEPDLVVASCEAFCSRVEECGGTLYASVWQYTTEQECVDVCVLLTRSTAIHNDDPECVDITMRKWDCASALPTCEDFEWFEYAAFHMTGLNSTSCGDAIYDVLTQCN